MKKGSSRLLIVPPSLDYGTEGSNNPSVPPGATLVFQIDMVRVSFKLRSHERCLSPFYVGDKIGGAFKRATFDLDMLISF